MPTPHKYAEVIKAWADGKTIQFRYLHAGVMLDWADFTASFAGCPDFCDTNGVNYEWRVKPEPVVLKYRRFIAKTGISSYVDTVIPDFGAGVRVEEQTNFVRWIDTEWQTVEL